METWKKLSFSRCQQLEVLEKKVLESINKERGILDPSSSNVTTANPLGTVSPKQFPSSLSQFRQHFTSTFCDDNHFDKKSQSRTVFREKLCNLLLCKKKRACKMLMKSTPWVNFANILRAPFAAIFFWQIITKPNCKWRKAVQYPKNTFAWKSCL